MLSINDWENVQLNTRPDVGDSIVKQNLDQTNGWKEVQLYSPVSRENKITSLPLTTYDLKTSVLFNALSSAFHSLVKFCSKCGGAIIFFLFIDLKCQGHRRQGRIRRCYIHDLKNETPASGVEYPALEISLPWSPQTIRRQTKQNEDTKLGNLDTHTHTLKRL